MRAPPPVDSLTPRKAAWDFPPATPRDWFAGSAALTSLLDVYTLVVPDNERFYIRTLQKCVPRLADPALRATVRDFFRQEALHGHAHGQYWARLRDEGIPVDRFVGLVNGLLYKVIEPILPQRLRVSSVAAIEHVNAYLGHVFLDRRLLRDADPALRRLFEWHFAEEIEHKAVAFDVLAATYPGYLTRLAGGLMTFALFHAILFGGTAYLLAVRVRLFDRRAIADFWRFWVRDGVLADSLRSMLRYLRPSFRPWDVDDYALAREFFATFEWEKAEP